MNFSRTPRTLIAMAISAAVSPVMADDAAIIKQLQEQMKQMQAQIDALSKKQGDVSRPAEAAAKPAADSKALEVYARVQVSVDNYSGDWDNEGTTVKSNASYIGVKGEMPTGLAGTDIIYQAEMLYGAADEDTAEIKVREGFAGLKGGWGKLRLGRLSTPYKATLTKIDPWLDLQPQSRGYGGKLGSSALHANYFNNALDYVTPSFNGFSGAIWHSQQLDSETSVIHNAGPLNNYQGGTATGLGVKYEKGPWYFGADWVTIDSDRIGTNVTQSTANLTTGVVTSTTAFKPNTKMHNGDGWQVAGRYKASHWSVAALYEDVEDLGLGKNLYLNGIYQLGKTSLIATAGRNRDASQFNNVDIDSWSVGVRHKLTKVSDVFIAYVNRDEGEKEYDVVTTGINAYFGK